ncbi:MAG: carbon-nitrogen hydrolase family protein [Sandaracinaceae bacterium]|nr:carbon-nitrogen hydrolase family protein [Sandaracinaceae bacterium]
MKKRVKVAVLQMNSTQNVEANLAQLEGLCQEAALDGAKLIVAPEGCAYLGSDSPKEGDPGKLGVAEPLPEGGTILNRIRSIAQRLGVEMVIGGFWEKSHHPQKVYNSCIHLDQEGRVRAVYRKMHLFDVDLPDGSTFEESKSVLAGDEVVTSESVAGVLGLSICYDLRFPELYRALVDRGATLIAVPAAFTLMTGKDHWHVLLRARAIESQCHVVAAAQWGEHGAGRRSYGHALIADPWGTVLAECGDGSGYASAWIDEERVLEVRRRIPALRHRRLGRGLAAGS